MTRNSLFGILGTIASLGCGCSSDASDELRTSKQRATLTEHGLKYFANDQESLLEKAECSAGSVRNIFVVAPSETGPYPVFLYMGGTWEAYNDEPTRRILEEAARQGFVAASVQYRNGTAPYVCDEDQVPNPDPSYPTIYARGWYKAQCAFSTDHNPRSAVAALCGGPAGPGFPAADCSMGIVTAGFSQGAWLAALGRNFDPRVRATWAMGYADRHADYYDQPCLDYDEATPFQPARSRLLPNNRLRVVRGANDWTAMLCVNPSINPNCGSSENQATEPHRLYWLGRSTGAWCLGPGSHDCLQADGSGWYLATPSEVYDYLNPVGHCFMQNNPRTITGAKVDCWRPPGVDPVFARIPEDAAGATYPSGMYQNILWLRGHVD